MAIPENQPLFTFAVFAYNHEKFIREAIEAAFAQTYRPLEIIISDDCSNDSTYAIAKKLCDGYCGPHSVVLIQNGANMGLASHINKVFRLAKGEMVVMAAGDDVSMPTRTEKLAEAWINNGRPSAVFSSILKIDRFGKPLRRKKIAKSDNWWLEKDRWIEAFSRNPIISVTGCCACWSSSLISDAMQLPKELVNEDNLLTLRAMLRKGVAYTDHELVAYRYHQDNIWSKCYNMESVSVNEVIRQEKSVCNKYNSYNFFLKLAIPEIKSARSENLISEVTSEKLVNACMEGIKKTSVRTNWWSYSFFKKFKNISTYQPRPGRAFVILLPLRMYAHFKVFILRFVRIRALLKIFRKKSHEP